MRIYIACLASYNAGRLHGEWIDATADADEMQEEVSRILRASPCPNVMVDCHHRGMFSQEDCPVCKGAGTVPSAEEFAIHDFDGLPSTLGEYCGLQAVADYVAFVDACEEHHGDGLDLAAAMVSNWHSVDDARQALGRLVTTCSSFRDYADETADEMLHGIAEFAQNYFDYDAFARDLAHDYTVLDMPDGVAIFHD